ncbi:molybdopterin synthase sulfur carrier subunit [Iodidimonas nitroreducens]|uniref:Molybdopterin synthase sulfur carrier subunit n=1 Tax=Iodidimonas nitroreducens TaxID=1236968 RepID=A0A5A7NBJ4_9PROT|nr:molybdopterin converting factor subunit 1 [Iodidimonas nitroreducens]GAK33210.1 molybdopterin synthase sulfur carrier subunit [alpha proteobacterium Q-1]GER04326.1 molybdopterin synthase sulfur carrier subunit [Iodidimonas nitroreducens]
MITCVYFAWVREGIGCESETIAPPADCTSLADIIHWLKGQSPGHHRVLADPSALRFAINLDHATLESPIREGDELAIFPPITGG